MKLSELLPNVSVFTNCTLRNTSNITLMEGKHPSYFTKWWNLDVELIRPFNADELLIYIREEEQ